MSMGGDMIIKEKKKNKKSLGLITDDMVIGYDMMVSQFNVFLKLFSPNVWTVNKDRH